MPRMLLVVLVFLACVSAAPRVRAQSDQPDVLYVSDWSVCSGTFGSCQGTDDSRTGVEGSWSEPFHVADPPQNQSQGFRDFTFGLEVAENAATFRVDSVIHQRVRTTFLVGGLLHGGGHTTNIKVFIHGEPGTRYALTTAYDGLLSVTGAGSSGTDASFLTAMCGSNCTFPMAGGPTTSMGRTSEERHPTRPGYTLAATVPVTFFSSSNYFFGNYDIVVVAQANYQISARRLRCLGGTIDIAECSPLRGRGTGPDFNYSAGISETVAFSGEAGDCSCCEYRRYVETVTSRIYGDLQHGPQHEDGHHGYRSGVDVRDPPVDRCSGRFDVFEPDRAGGCMFFAEDRPGPTNHGLGGARYEALFEGRIVEKAECAGGTERTLVTRQWTVCIAFAGNPFTGFVPVPCTRAYVGPAVPATPTPASVGGTPAQAWAFRVGPRFSASVTVGGGVLPPTTSADAELQIAGLTAITPPGGFPATMVIQDSSSRATVITAFFEATGPLPTTLPLTIRIGTASARVDIPLSSVGLYCTGDRDGDGGVTVDDLLAYIEAYAAGSNEADMNFDAGVTVDDLLEYLTAYYGGC